MSLSMSCRGTSRASCVKAMKLGGFAFSFVFLTTVQCKNLNPPVTGPFGLSVPPSPPQWPSFDTIEERRRLNDQWNFLMNAVGSENAASCGCSSWSLLFYTFALQRVENARNSSNCTWCLIFSVLLLLSCGDIICEIDTVLKRISSRGQWSHFADCWF